MDHGECRDRAQIGMARCLLYTLFAQCVGGYNLTADPRKVQRSIAILLILINDNDERGVPCFFPEKLSRLGQIYT